MKSLSKKGFTVVELLTSMGIVSVMMAVAVPNILGWIPDHQLKSASRNLYDNIQLARISAIKTGQDCYLDFNEPEEGQYTLSLGGGTVKTEDLTAYGDSLEFDDPPERISFRSNGLSRSNEKQVVDITTGDKSFRTTVFVSGAIKLEER